MLIVDLPTEILDQIFNGLISWEHKFYGYKRNFVNERHLSLTCKRFNEVFRPILYRQSDIKLFVPRPPNDRLSCLTDTMQSSELQPLCKDLSLKMGDWEHGHDVWARVNDFMSLLTGLRSLTIWGRTETVSLWLTLLRTIQHKSLEKISVGNLWCKSKNPDSAQRLRSLMMNSLGGDYSCDIEEFIKFQQDKGLTPTITTVDAYSNVQSNSLLPEFFTWFVGLEHFRFLNTHCPRVYGVFDTLGYIVLQKHQETLKSIRFGLNRTVEYLFDLTTFPRLERLALCAYNLYSITPEQAALKLLAPSLSSFTIHYFEGRNERLVEFTQEHADWISHFAEHAKRTHLQNVHIVFGPDKYRFKKEWAIGNSKSLINEVKRAIQPLGIELTYSEPTISEILCEGDLVY